MLALPSSDYLQLVYRPDLMVLVGRWMRQTTPQEMRHGYALLLNGGEAQNCCYWLMDARRRDQAASEQDVSWMMETFFPQVAARLGQPVFIAYLFAPTHLIDIETNPAIPPLTYFDNRPYRIGRFIEERTALEWLTACRTVASQQ
ncbi:hypothetical protein [Hymenobacter sp.]|jgi:hypothetical protein|uniref:hypothetical protein n=1 Tax=Hymenobacter sp. TaxID=1898978 RepID=UPI002ED98EDD